MTDPSGPVADLRFSVSGRIDRPVADVYDAVAEPDRLSAYFTTGGADGRLETGATVEWDFADFPGAFPVEVVEAQRPSRLVLRWGAEERVTADGGAFTTVTFTFEALEAERTLVSITEESWRGTEQGRDAAFGNCEGWTGMLCALKVWLEHDITLREGFYK